ncbi:unnamed protein product [Rotaria socialis]|uniref:Uncharacterized protein n=2 Tax=Rotaria socialis TaxID=392032 RepID=A0A818CWA5_9BILA|nr:unnamed protein product [Rotaria socialis]CAF3434329.1 unnamed protein product [Rotaria socialis]CAF3457596.1 unnamed protein product [Rotaria socialis]CAF3540369.1 unnamed protein product [Rotaria socialis]
MKRYLSILIILFIEIDYSFSKLTMASKNLEAASATYLRLKNVHGHWHNQPHNPATDNFQGERHQAMIELQQNLGKAGTSGDEIQHLMGTPTKILNKPDLVLEHEFRRENENYTYPKDAKIWIYEWRGFHDYVYFVVSNDNKVLQSDWYSALE